MMYWIYDYPSWVIGFLFCATLVALTWIGILLTRVTVHSWLHREKRANEMVGLALSSYFVLFGLLLGLVAVATYQNFATSRNGFERSLQPRLGKGWCAEIGLIA